MIEIENIDKNKRMFGEHLYQLRLNGNVIGTFMHDRVDGLSVCLKKAAEVTHEGELTGLKALMHSPQSYIMEPE